MYINIHHKVEFAVLCSLYFLKVLNGVASLSSGALVTCEWTVTHLATEPGG